MRQSFSYPKIFRLDMNSCDRTKMAEENDADQLTASKSESYQGSISREGSLLQAT